MRFISEYNLICKNTMNKCQVRVILTHVFCCMDKNPFMPLGKLKVTKQWFLWQCRYRPTTKNYILHILLVNRLLCYVFDCSIECGVLVSVDFLKEGDSSETTYFIAIRNGILAML